MCVHTCVFRSLSRYKYGALRQKLKSLVSCHIMTTVTQLLDRPSQRTDNQHPMVLVPLYFHYMDQRLYALHGRSMVY